MRLHLALALASLAAAQTQPQPVIAGGRLDESREPRIATADGYVNKKGVFGVFGSVLDHLLYQCIPFDVTRGPVDPSNEHDSSARIAVCLAAEDEVWAKFYGGYGSFGGNGSAYSSDMAYTTSPAPEAAETGGAGEEPWPFELLSFILGQWLPVPWLATSTACLRLV